MTARTSTMRTTSTRDIARIPIEANADAGGDPGPGTGPRPRLRIRGAFTALVTPFGPDGSLDERAFRRLVDHQVRAGIDGLVPCGTTGESPTLSPDERERVIALTVEAAAASRRHIPVVAGTGTNDTAATIRASRRAAALGADAALVVAPYYNRPDQRMLEAHFRAVADEGGLPVVVYNVPSRTGTNVEAATLLRLAEHPRIVAVKEASANLEQIASILRERPAGFAVMSGDDAWTIAVLAMGGDGVVSVASNEIPAGMVALCDAARTGDWDAARALHARWLPLFRANFQGGPNPVPVKAALSMMGMLEDALRLPLLPLDGPPRERLRAVLAAEGLLDAAARDAGADATEAEPAGDRYPIGPGAAVTGHTLPGIAVAGVAAATAAMAEVGR
jgi:4-hydroxy-tetrahydrodipicolinate synthase